jgi:hypothetical protein
MTNYCIKFKDIKYPNIEEVNHYSTLFTTKYTKVFGKIITEDIFYENDDIITSVIIPEKYIISIEKIS